MVVHGHGKKHVDLVTDLIDTFYSLNTYSKFNLGFEIFRAESKTLNDLRKKVRTSEDFHSFISRLALLTNDIYGENILSIFTPRRTGSINIIEELFEYKGINYDKNSILGLRNLHKIRSYLSPTHSLDHKAIPVLRSINLDFPIKNYEKAAFKCIANYLKYLKSIERSIRNHKPKKSIRANRGDILLMCQKFEDLILSNVLNKIPSIEVVRDLHRSISKKNENLLYGGLVNTGVFEEIYSVLRKGNESSRRYFHITKVQGASKRKDQSIYYSEVTLAQGILVLGVGQESKMKKLKMVLDKLVKDERLIRIVKELYRMGRTMKGDKSFEDFKEVVSDFGFPYYFANKVETNSYDLL